MRVVRVNLPEPLLEGLDHLVKLRLYPHRSEAIRVAVKDLLDKVRRLNWAIRDGGEHSALDSPILSNLHQYSILDERKGLERDEQPI